MSNISPELETQVTYIRPNPWPVRFIAGIVFLNGFLAIVEALYTHLSPSFERYISVDYDLYGRLFGVFAGFLLIYFSSQLLARKRLAWWMAYVSTVILTISHAAYARDLAAFALPLLTLILLSIYQSEFVVKNELQSVAQGARLLALCLIVALAYGSVGFARLAPRDYVPAHCASLLEGAGRTLKEFSLVGNSDISTHSRRARLFIDSLDLLGTISITLAFYSLFRPLAYRYGTLPQERDRARLLIRKYGDSSEDEFKLWPEDKAYYFGPDDETVVAYRVDHGTALVLGEPIGPQAEWPALLREFKRFCQVHDWSVTFIYVVGPHVKLFETEGFRPLKIGEDAVVTCSEFAETTIRSKHFRGVMNKFRRLGYTFEIAEAPVANETLLAAARVTKAWLGVDGRSEHSFALGYHDRAYLRRNTMYLVRDNTSRLVAFANAVESHNQNQATIDLMRYRPSIETGIMDYLLASIILKLAEDKVLEFSLGLAPLAGVGEGPNQTLEERVIAIAGRLGVGGFAFEGLRRFKNKFEPRWQPRYLVYERGPAGLARTLLAIKSLLGG